MVKELSTSQFFGELFVCINNFKKNSSLERSMWVKFYLNRMKRGKTDENKWKTFVGNHFQEQCWHTTDFRAANTCDESLKWNMFAVQKMISYVWGPVWKGKKKPNNNIVTLYSTQTRPMHDNNVLMHSKYQTDLKHCIFL